MWWSRSQRTKPRQSSHHCRPSHASLPNCSANQLSSVMSPRKTLTRRSPATRLCLELCFLLTILSVFGFSALTLLVGCQEQRLRLAGKMLLDQSVCPRETCERPGLIHGDHVTYTKIVFLSFFRQGSHASWKVLDFFLENSRAWKVLENHFGPGKSWKLKLKVLESPGKISLKVMHFFSGSNGKQAAIV